MGRRRSAKEIEERLERRRASGMSREEYCGQVGIALSTLDANYGEEAAVSVW